MTLNPFHLLYFYKTSKPASTLILIIFLAACANAPQKPSRITPGDYGYATKYAAWIIEKTMKERDLVGVSAAIVDDQRIVWARGFGYADKKNNVHASADTVYRAGSITKLFTASAVMQLTERGMLDIDKPLSDYIPELHLRNRFDEKTMITARTVMTHHSGLPSNLFHGMWTAEPASFTRVAERMAGHYVAFPPNYVLSYSNLGFSLLGHTVVNVSGQSYAGYINNNLLLPLGMEHSKISQGIEKQPLAAKPYRKGKPAHEYRLRDTPAGGLNTSVTDLARFAKMIFARGRIDGATVLSEQSIQSMLRKQNTSVTLDLDQAVGLAWFLDSENEDVSGLVAMHDGGTTNFRSMLLLSIDHKIGVIVMTNSYEGAMGEVATEILKQTVGSKLGHLPPAKKTNAPIENVKPIAENEHAAGYYATMMGLLEITPKGDNFKLLIHKDRLNLIKDDNGLFKLDYKILGLIPVNLGPLGHARFSFQSIGGREILVAHNGHRRLLFGSKIKPAVIPKQWRSLTGSYRLVNKEDSDLHITDTELVIRDNLLILEMGLSNEEKEKMNFALAPVSDHEAVIQGIGRNMGSTVFARTQGDHHYLEFSGFILERFR